MNRKYLVYTFTVKKNLTYKLLRGLEHKDTSKIFMLGQKGVVRLVEQILKNHYPYILGLGDFRKNAKRIRVEEKFINRYGKSKIINSGPKYYYATWKILLGENMCLSPKTSNGPCNRSACLVADTIKKNRLNAKFAFIHIPKDSNIKEAQNLLKNLLSERVCS